MTAAQAQSPATLASALASVQAKLPTITKSQTANVPTKTGGSYSYSYADLATVSQIILPALGAAGLSWVTKPTVAEDGRFVLRYKLLHSSGECEEGDYPLGTVGTPQQVGSAITYARRYALCAVTGVAPEDDDDDGAAATVAVTEARARQNARSSERPRSAPAPAAAQGNSAALIDPSGPQMAKLHAGFGDLGITDRELGLQYCIDIIGREITSTKELTRSEAAAVIDQLVKDAEPAPPGHGDYAGAEALPV